MRRNSLKFTRAAGILALCCASFLAAQTPELQQKVASIKESMSRNQQQLARYMWQEQQTISLNGEVKKEMLYLVQLGPDGKPQKQQLSESPQPSPEQDSSGRRGRIREKVVEKKTAEYKQYGQQIGALVQAYAQPDPGRLQQSFQQGNAMLGGSGVPGQIQLQIRNYVKPGDSVQFVFNPQTKDLESIDVSSYLNDPSDAVTMSVRFIQLPDGTNHVDSAVVNGIGKNLTVNIQNANYRRM
jgi:hypothetical protein